MPYEIVPLTLSYYEAEKGYMTYMTGYGQSIIRPFVVWFIRGASKNIIVDSGIEAQDYVAYHPSFNDLKVNHLQTFDQAMASVGITAEQVDIVVQTHLHFDHCHNLKRCVNAEVLLQKAEYDFAMDPAPFAGIYRRELWEGANLRLIEGEYEIEPGLTLMPTPGHAAGGQAVLVDTQGGTVAIAGMCTCQENFYPSAGHPMVGDDQTLLPGILLNARDAYESMKRLQSRTDRILALHDPDILHQKIIS
ncbi:MAG: N-acyl homoserine lactonase family protein [Desulfarculaceae bacterium]|nr:N-acyl homoserine lactonase family protein [Desulfarculaceae bacterium]MCF8047902.1 N-acyl homoserine lactonase family protein [Desulfarculaceae bacterium]MCF8064433.1 N-acyl homoserine lactonase family protein [Desulfarculaceae bacterium]MCF8097624.1 N-acyl homoserine lactonase family protein [Desulfarculaceae bacterium]MCF8122378.1 N-acyl homoserine lactonase family protein [Desulfarculaceae bacterium]